jgi:hypothetical protein
MTRSAKAGTRCIGRARDAGHVSAAYITRLDRPTTFRTRRHWEVGVRTGTVATDTRNPIQAPVGSGYALSGGEGMSVDAVPASPSRETTVASWWFRFIVRAVLALLALWVLTFVDDRYEAWLLSLRRFRQGELSDALIWLSWIGAAVVAGLLFGMATWLPFAAIGYRWSRLVLAAVALAPIAQYWWVWIYQLQRHGEVGGWLYRANWFSAETTQTALAVLTGVAIASGFRAKNSEAAGPDR